MSRFTLLLYYHDLCRTVQCCLCASLWEEQWVGATLMDDQVAFGSLCPRCVQTPPHDSAIRLRQTAEHMQSLVNGFVMPSASVNADGQNDQGKRVLQLTEAARFGLPVMQTVVTTLASHCTTHPLLKEVDEVTRETKEAFREDRMPCATGSTATKMTTLLGAMEAVVALSAYIEVLQFLADACLMTEGWPLTVSEVMAAERLCCLRRLGGIKEADVLRIVDNRYAEFLLSELKE